MTVKLCVQAILGATLVLTLIGLFQLYKNPLLEIYLANWGLC